MALLVRDGMRGFGGISKTEFYELSWREIYESYFVEFTEDGELVPIRERIRRIAERRQEEREGVRRKLPTIEELNVPEAVQSCGVPLDFCRCWWAIWRARDVFTTEQLEAKWWQERRVTRPHDWREPESLTRGGSIPESEFEPQDGEQ